MGQLCALLWLLMRGHRGLSATRRFCPNGFIHNKYGRYKNSRTTAASFVPHQHFSGAKINIISETSKLFPNYFFIPLQKTSNAGHKTSIRNV
jgi:hypothetical protein